MQPKSVFPQTVRFGVLSWKKGTRRAGWVARGSELGAQSGWAPTGWGARGYHGTGWVARGSELVARGLDGLADRIVPAKPHQIPAPDTESAGPHRECRERTAGLRHIERRALAQTQKGPGSDERRGPIWSTACVPLTGCLVVCGWAASSLCPPL